MDVNEYLDALDSLIADASKMPFVDKILIDDNEIIRIIDDMRNKLPAELQEAREVLKRRDELIEAAKYDADQLVKKANEDATDIMEKANAYAAQKVDETEIVQEANDRAQALMQDAERQAEELIQNTVNKATEMHKNAITYSQQLKDNAESYANQVFDHVISQLSDASDRLNTECQQVRGIVGAVQEAKEHMNERIEEEHSKNLEAEG